MKRHTSISDRSSASYTFVVITLCLLKQSGGIAWNRCALGLIDPHPEYTRVLP